MKQSDEDFLKMMLGERIDLLLKGKKREKLIAALEEAEAVIAGLTEDQREKLRTWLDISMDLETEDQQRIYLGGFADGIWLAGKVYLAGGKEWFFRIL